MTLRVAKRDALYGFLTLFLCGLVVGIVLSEVERSRYFRDRLESLNDTLSTIGGR